MWQHCPELKATSSRRNPAALRCRTYWEEKKPTPNLSWCNSADGWPKSRAQCCWKGRAHSPSCHRTLISCWLWHLPTSPELLLLQHSTNQPEVGRERAPNRKKNPQEYFMLGQWMNCSQQGRLRSRAIRRSTEEEEQGGQSNCHFLAAIVQLLVEMQPQF